MNSSDNFDEEIDLSLFLVQENLNLDVLPTDEGNLDKILKSFADEEIFDKLRESFPDEGNLDKILKSFADEEIFDKLRESFPDEGNLLELFTDEGNLDELLKSFTDEDSSNLNMIEVRVAVNNKFLDGQALKLHRYTNYHLK
jgi:uncharacterized protein YjgD (DUF1641 family)